ncbi:MAG TPA: hypothetical protein PLH39_04460, partial [Promineifilum sp.]|nr:hypothetical protein [Promineifilum sp.]
MDMRRRTYVILIGIILLTIPCYISGIALLARAPDRQGDAETATPGAPVATATDEATRRPPSIVSATPPGSPTPMITVTASITPTPSPTTTASAT